MNNTIPVIYYCDDGDGFKNVKAQIIKLANNKYEAKIKFNQDYIFGYPNSENMCAMVHNGQIVSMYYNDLQECWKFDDENFDLALNPES